MTSRARNEQQPSSGLNEQARALLHDFVTGLPAGQQTLLEQAMAELMASSAGAQAVGTDDRAPDFELPRADGARRRLGDYLAQGPVVLSFYRGGWCPFCNLEFRALHERLPEIQALGATLVGVSPEIPDTAIETVAQHQLEFDVLSDVGNRVAERYGLVMTVPAVIRPIYLQWGIDLPRANGDDSWRLPLPATYVIDGGGTVRAAYVNKDYTQRMEPADIVTALQALAG